MAHGGHVDIPEDVEEWFVAHGANGWNVYLGRRPGEGRRIVALWPTMADKWDLWECPLPCESGRYYATRQRIPNAVVEAVDLWPSGKVTE
jgi:hypothetical protein